MYKKINAHTQTHTGSFKSPNDDSIIIERNNWSEIHLGIVYQYENSDPGLERPFTIQLHYRGTCIQSNYPFLELHSSNYCPPEVLNQASDQNQACHQLILLVQGTNDTDNAIIGLNKDCVFQGSVNNKTLPLENQLTLQIKVIGKKGISFKMKYA